MEEALKSKILALLDEHRIMTIATVRPDGWPQATTIGHDTPDIMKISGLSMAAHAYAVVDRAEAEKVLRMLPLKYRDSPPLAMKMPSPDEVRLFRVVPSVISVLDYTKGFGHSDLVECPR